MSSKFLLIVLLPVFAFSCKKSDSPTGPIPHPAGQQHDVPWPSLANSPWPMNHGNPQSTGRARILGPSNGDIQWQINTPSRSSAGVAVTADSLLITGYHLTAFDLRGSVKWAYPPQNQQDWVVTTPIITAQGAVIGGTNEGTVYCVDGTGSLLWEVGLGEGLSQQGTNLGLDGTFYCISGAQTVFAISATGHIAWQLKDSRFNGGPRSTLTLSPDGRTLYVPGVGVALNAVDIASHSVVWRFGESKELDLAPLVDCDGGIYVLAADSLSNSKPALFRLSPNGTVDWVYVHGNSFDQIYAGDPTLDFDGNFYFALDTLYSVDFAGHLRWKRPLPASSSIAAGDVPLVCDNRNYVYAIVTNLSLSDYQITGFDNSGSSVLSQLISPAGYFIDSSPAIIGGGYLAVAGFDNGKLYLFR